MKGLLPSIAEQVIHKLSVDLDEPSTLKFKQMKDHIIIMNDTDSTMQMLREKTAEASVYNRATQLKPLSSNVDPTIVQTDSTYLRTEPAKKATPPSNLDDRMDQLTREMTALALLIKAVVNCFDI